MNLIMDAHKELTEDLELIIETIVHPDYEELSEEVRDVVMKERNRLEMLLEVLEEDSEYERDSL